MSELVAKLSNGDHDVEIWVHPEKSVEAFKERLDDGYVHVRFPNTRGGTTLGVTVTPEMTDLSAADFSSQTGRVVLAGHLTLDYVPVICQATIELPALTGAGRLIVQPE